MLAKAASYPGSEEDPLSKIAQFFEEVQGDRSMLLQRVVSIFGPGLPGDYSTAATEFFRTIPDDCMPRLIVTTNYDILVERALEARKRPYLAIAHIARNSKYSGRFLCYDALNRRIDDCIWTRTKLEDHLQDANEDTSPPVLLYKIHGTAQAARGPNDLIDSVVLTESDYIEFIEDERLNKIPPAILKTLRESSLLFLGYSLEDWNFRVLIQRLQRIQQQKRAGTVRHWACRLMEKQDEVEKTFWATRGVNLYSRPLQDFLAALLSELAGSRP